MNFYDDLVMQTQMNYSRHYHIYASGGTPYQLTDKKPLPYSEQIHRLVQEVKEADCVVVGGASGLSAAGGGDFYYEDNDSYRKYFRPFAEKYHFKGAFAGMMHPWKTRGVSGLRQGREARCGPGHEALLRHHCPDHLRVSGRGCLQPGRPQRVERDQGIRS